MLIYHWKSKSTHSYTAHCAEIRLRFTKLLLIMSIINLSKFQEQMASDEKFFLPYFHLGLGQFQRLCQIGSLRSAEVSLLAEPPFQFENLSVCESSSRPLLPAGLGTLPRRLFGLVRRAVIRCDAWGRRRLCKVAGVRYGMGKFETSSARHTIKDT